MANSKEPVNEPRTLKYELQEFNYDADFGIYNRYKGSSICTGWILEGIWKEDFKS